MDPRKIKLMTMHKALHPWDDIDRLYMSKKKEEEDSLVLTIAWMHRYDYSKITK